MFHKFLHPEQIKEDLLSLFQLVESVNVQLKKLNSNIQVDKASLKEAEEAIILAEKAICRMYAGKA